VRGVLVSRCSTCSMRNIHKKTPPRNSTVCANGVLEDSENLPAIFFTAMVYIDSQRQKKIIKNSTSWRAKETGFGLGVIMIWTSYAQTLLSMPSASGLPLPNRASPENSLGKILNENFSVWVAAARSHAGETRWG
jgi:hypothetical protein